MARLIAFYPPAEGFFTQKRSPSKPQIKSPHFGPPQNEKSLKIYNWQFKERNTTIALPNVSHNLFPL